MLLLRKLTLCMVMVMLIHGAVDAVCPPELDDIQLKPQHAVIKHGDPVSVNCSTSSNSTRLSWTAPPEHVQWNDHTQTASWKMDALTDWDIQMVCYVDSNDVQCNRTLSLIIYKTPDHVSISTVGPSGPMTEGEQYELQCDIQNVAPVRFLTVKWFKGEKIVRNESFTDQTKTPVNQTAKLQITPSRHDNGTEYRCEAELDLGPDGPHPPPTVTSDPLTFIVHYAPEFDCLSIYEEREHSLLHNCTVMASPAANVSWYKDGVEVEPPHNLTRRDSGSYRITAWNERGSAHHSLSISVLYGPEIESGDSSVEALKDRSVSLTCTAEGNPEPEVTWIFMNQTKATERRQTTLNFSATSEDSGEYTCTATNKIGMKTRKVTLAVNGVCPLTLQPPEVVVEHGATASANCSTTKSHGGMGWEASQGSVDMRDDVQLITWHVQNLTVWEIKPYCFINVDKTEPCRHDLRVTVYKTPDSVSINVMNHFTPMTEDKQYTLRCLVQNVAPAQLVTVKWFKGDTLVANTSTKGQRIQRPETLTPKFQITPSRHDNGTEYRCEAELDLGPDGPQPPPIMSSEPLPIIVYYKPAINCSDWIPLVNTPLNTRSNTVTGNPTPHITWFQSNSLVESSKRLSKQDSGQYKYIASNEMGEASCITNITVEYAPEFDCLSSYEAREHSLFQNCSVMASPAASVSWHKDGMAVEPPHNLTRKHNGFYSITAWNKHGTEVHHLTISVLYGPEIESGESSVEVFKGRSVSLTCTAKGNPEPEVMWIFMNQTKATGGRQTTLTFSVTSEDSGEYTCTATNKIGMKSRKVTLAVNDYLTLIIFISVLFIIIIFIIALLVFCVTRRRSGKYEVQCNGEAHSMSLLNDNIHG